MKFMKVDYSTEQPLRKLAIIIMGIRYRETNAVLSASSTVLDAKLKLVFDLMSVFAII